MTLDFVLGTGKVKGGEGGQEGTDTDGTVRDILGSSEMQVLCQRKP